MFFNNLNKKNSAIKKENKLLRSLKNLGIVLINLPFDILRGIRDNLLRALETIVVIVVLLIIFIIILL